MYRFLLSPRWLVLALIAGLSVPGCLWLAGWQFGRLHDAQDRNDLIRTNAEAPAVPVAQISEVDAQIPEALDYRAVTARGRYDLERTVFVRNRPRDGAQGYHVLVPLLDSAGGPAVLVNRGWVRAPLSGDPPPDPPAPDGTVQISGHLRPSQGGPEPGPAPPDDVPEGQILSIDVAWIATTVDYPILGGYLQLADQSPAIAVAAGRRTPDPVALPGSSSELLHRSYGWQWYVFAAIGPIGFVLLARREAADQARPPSAAPRPSPSGPPR